MTSGEQYIYNTYLMVSRSRQNKPYKRRKNFDNFKDNPNYVFIKRLSMFFNKHSNINIVDFFNAPYKVYPEQEQSYDLRFYTTPKCMRLYGLYVKKLDMEDPDSDTQISRIKSSLLFIFKFCKGNGLTVSQYTKHKTNDIPTFILHLQRRDVTIYSLYEFDNLDTEMRSIPNDRLKFTLGDQLVDNVGEFKLKYYKSNKAKQILRSGKQKIETLLNKINNNI